MSHDAASYALSRLAELEEESKKAEKERVIAQERLKILRILEKWNDNSVRKDIVTLCDLAQNDDPRAQALGAKLFQLLSGSGVSYE